MLSLLKWAALLIFLLGSSACCHGSQIVYTDWVRDPTGNTRVRACVDDTTAPPSPGATDTAGYGVIAQLTAADIREASLGGFDLVTAHDAVEWLAPWWFHQRVGNLLGEVAVYLGSNHRFGDKESLRHIRATDVFLLTYVETVDVHAPFERDATRGAIVVTLR